MVQCGLERSMEEHFPTYLNELGVRISTHYEPSMAPVAKPTVDEICLEELPECFAKAGLVRVG